MQAGAKVYGRKLTPALIAVLVHGALFAGFMTLGFKGPAPLRDETLPIVWIPAPFRVPLQPFVPTAPPLMAPPLSVPPHGMPAVPPASVGMDLPALGVYVGCGLGQALTAEERSRCDEIRTQIYARPAVPNTDHVIALEQRFSRDKALQDMSLLRACYRRSGPDPLCFARGYETLVGSTAARDSVLNTLADPLRPR